jgi:hypothetical protein
VVLALTLILAHIIRGPKQRLRRFEQIEIALLILMSTTVDIRG